MINGDTAFFDGKPESELTKYIKEMNRANNTYSGRLTTIDYEDRILNKLRVREKENKEDLER